MYLKFNLDFVELIHTAIACNPLLQNDEFRYGTPDDFGPLTTSSFA
jgi:hypothetical protein